MTARPPALPVPTGERLSQLALDFGPPPPPSLDNYVAGPNAAAVEALRALAAGRRGAQRFVYLWGPPGTGKSHLLGAVSAARAHAHAQAQAHAHAGAAPATLPPAIDAVDDVERLDATAQHALFARWIDIQGDPARALVAAGSLPPAQLALRADLRSRLAGALVFALQPLDDGDKARALREAASRRGFDLGPDALAHLLALLPRDMASLAAAVDALDRYALARKRAVTLPLLRDWLQAGVR